MDAYEVYVEDGQGHFVRAPDPPPHDWRERKGVCRRCGEKVFVKAGPLRSFWTHGKGRTCVPRPNLVARAIAVAEYAKNKGAMTDGDEELSDRFITAQLSGVSESAITVHGEVQSSAELQGSSTKSGGELKTAQARSNSQKHYSDEESDRRWREDGYADYWKKRLAAKRAGRRRF